MASPNPLQRTTPIIHLPLAILAALFLGPMVWLFATSLQPREQVGKVPPELLPSQYYITEGAQHVYVTPPQPVGSPKLLVVPSAGPNRGEQLLVDPKQFQDGKLTQGVRVADRIEQQSFDAQLVRPIAADSVLVKEWLLSKYTKKAARVFYVPRSEVKTEKKPVWGNYTEAIKALTSGEKAKGRPMSELLGLSVFPWTEKGAPGRTITFLTYLSNTLVVAFL